VPHQYKLWPYLQILDKDGMAQIFYIITRLPQLRSQKILYYCALEPVLYNFLLQLLLYRNKLESLTVPVTSIVV
jgi:hypothetical protein